MLGASCAVLVAPAYHLPAAAKLGPVDGRQFVSEQFVVEDIAVAQSTFEFERWVLLGVLHHSA